MFLSNQVQFGLSENMVPQISPLITMFPSHIAIPAGVYPIFQTSKSYVVGYIPSNFVTMVIFFPRFPWLVVYLTYPSEKWWSSSVGMITHSQLNGKIIQLCSKQTTLNYQAVSWRARDNQEIRVDFGNVVQDPNGIAAQCLQHHLSDTNPIVGRWSIWWAFNHQRRDVDQPILGRSNAKPL